MHIYQILLVAVAGAAGTLARYATQLALAPASARFPYGTLAANVSGCLAIGILCGLLVDRALLRPEYRVALLVGFLGGYTTFSSFALETMSLLRNGHVMRAFTYLLASNLLGIACVMAGYALARPRP